MALLLIFGGLAGLLFIFSFCLSIFHHLTSPLRPLPGPFLARFTDLWFLWKASTGEFERTNQELHNEYGPIVRYGPGRYSFSHPDASRIIYGPGAQFPKSSWYSASANPGKWTLFSDRDMQRHAHNRRLVQGLYSMTSLLTYEPYVDECNELLCQRLQEMAAERETVNMAHWLQCYAFDVIGMITYSKRLGFLDRGEDIGQAMAAINKELWYATLIGIFPRIHPLLFYLRSYFASRKAAGRVHLMKFTTDMIREHQERTKEKPEQHVGTSEPTTAVDFVTKLVQKHEADPTTFTPYHVLATCTNNMVAGSDTTAATLSAILYYLLKTPRAFARLREEVDASKPDLSFADAQKLPYLQATIKEALRMHPPVGFPLEREVPPGGVTIAGVFFPEGTVVGTNPWVEHRDRGIFGADADAFRPERWLIDDDDDDDAAEKLSRMNHHWVPFSQGSRNCIGRHVALLEISKLVPRLLREFDFALGEELRAPGREWATTNKRFVKPDNFFLTVTPRTVPAQV
ncbi:cytochrome P450 [Xylariomycetidae sp. FL0641]|nr:cytochrome P450 [Xylariomycetidae sp. FL0641]